MSYWLALPLRKLSTFVESTSETPVSTNAGNGELDSRLKSVVNFSLGG